MNYQALQNWSPSENAARPRVRKTALNIPKMPKLFIPEIGIFGNYEVPSTPFKIERKEPVFIGDIIEVIFTDSKGRIENKEYYMADLIDGQYVGIFNNSEDGNMLLAELVKTNKKRIKVIGNAYSEPTLRIKLLNQ